MFTSTLTALFVLGTPVAPKPLTCAVMAGNPVKETGPAAEYAGVKFTFCCPGCDTTFIKDPNKYVTQAAKKGTVIGESMFDAVSGERLDFAKSKFKADYKGVRYSFSSDANLKAFNADPGKFATWPKQVSLVCAVAGDPVDAYSFSAGYVDFEGVRYFVCCSGCLPALRKDTAKIIGEKNGKVIATPAMPFKDGKPTIHDYR